MKIESKLSLARIYDTEAERSEAEGHTANAAHYRHHAAALREEAAELGMDQ